ncbi:unnamed protein product, partial [marine sediment metagenome]
MHYWNKDNFEGFEDIAAHLGDDPLCGDLAEYCRLRASGLRREAFKALDRFMDKAAALPTAEKREVINLVYDLALRMPHVHQFIPTPLATRFLGPELEKWLAEVPASLPALRWDGIFWDNAESLKRALEIDPDDALVRRYLINRECLSLLDYGFHHIAEGGLLLEVAVIEDLLAQGEIWLARAPDDFCFD